MKAKVSRGGGFRGALNYVLDVGKDATGDKLAEIVGGTMVSRDAAGMSQEFSAVRQLRPDIKRPVWHCSLSLPAGDKLDSSKWQEVADDFMQEMGFPADTQYTVVRHGDTDKDHVHIVASRISLSGNVWHGKFEALEAINATQRLEQRHGLTLTPGLGGADDETRAPEAKLTTQELSKAERLGVQPPRLVITNAIADVLKQGKQSLTDFIQRLRDKHDVHVVPRISSQKKLVQGMNFEHQGLVFAGGDVATGRAYTWGNLKKKGISYEPERDYQAASDAAAAATERRSDREASNADTAGVISPANSNSHGTIGPAPAGLYPRSEPVSTAPDSGINAKDDAGQHEPGAKGAISVVKAKPGIGGGDRKQGHSISNEGGNGGQKDSGSQEATRTNSQGSGSGQQNSQESGMESSTNKRPSVSNTNGGGSSWNSRFKQASAARRRERDGTTNTAPGEAGRMAAAAGLQSAKTVDPTSYLESAGYVVKREGRHLSVRTPSNDEVYRITEKEDGHYVACDLYQNGVGDNISLVQAVEPGTSFTDAIYRLNGGRALTEAVHPETKREARIPPRLPRQSDQDGGRAYLQVRGADASVVANAERYGFVRYLKGAVVFCGRDGQGTVQNATRRATSASDPIQRRDFRGSDKQYAPILPGDKSNVWIVEGGVDALAAQTLALKQGKPQPTVIVSGGAGVRSWLENDRVQDLLTQASSITLTTDLEKDAKTQAETDSHHQKQVERIQELTGHGPEVWKPKHGATDLADYVQSGAYKKDIKAPELGSGGGQSAPGPKRPQARAPQQRRYYGSGLSAPQPQRPRFK